MTEQMNTNVNHTQFEDLAIKYLAGSATPREEEQLEIWVKNDEEKRRLFLGIKKSWMLASASGKVFHKSHAWEKIASQTFQSAPEVHIRPLQPKPSPPLRKIWGMAAAVLLLIVGMYSVYHFSGTREKVWVAADQPLERTLRDASRIYLHRNSTLTYPARFMGNERRVNLVGEAFFEVTPQAQKPFVVETSQIEIHVLGTSFYVNTHGEADKTEVIVQTGKVAMIASESVQLPLTEGKRGIYHPEKNELTEARVENPNFLSWKTRILVFEDSGLKEVFEVIGDTYGVNIRLSDNSLENCRLTAVFNDKTLDEVLAIVAETFSLRYTRSQEEILVSGQGC